MIPLSVVTTSRNDDHGHSLSARTQQHIDCLYEQATEFRTPVEYILVEWNPPAGIPPITEAVRVHDTSEYWHPRVITVPGEIHRTYQYSDRLPIFQMIAKNVGIRRSAGEYILCTNVDVLISDEMFLFITGPLLASGVSYRTDRWDAWFNPDLSTRTELFEYCKSHIIRRCGRGEIKTRNPVTHGARWVQSVLDRGVDATLYREYGAYGGTLPNVHTMACGDFTLLDRDTWFALHGYPEMEIFSIHLDSLFLIQAFYSGVREVIVPFPIFHLEHAIGTGLVPGGDALMYRNLTRRGIPYLPLVSLAHLAEGMQTNRHGEFRKVNGYWVYKKNLETWGLCNYTFPEVRP